MREDDARLVILIAAPVNAPERRARHVHQLKRVIGGSWQANGVRVAVLRLMPSKDIRRQEDRQRLRLRLL